jgi:hypothetical protein
MDVRALIMAVQKASETALRIKSKVCMPVYSAKEAEEKQGVKKRPIGFLPLAQRY